MPHVLLVVNPFASRVNERRLRKVEEALASAGSVETVLTERAGHATELAARETDALVVYGGDGVVNEALNGVGDVPFGALPGGGTSVFVRALGLPRDAVAAATAVAEAIVAGRTRRISLGRIEGRRFGFAAGVGFDAATVRRVDALGRTKDGRRPGDIAFAYELVRVFGRERFTLEPSMEIAGPRARGGGDDRELRPVHLRRGGRAARRRRRAFRARPRLRRARLASRQAKPAAPRALRRARKGRAAPGPAAARTTSTGSRSRATARCRCRSTAKTSATSSTS